MFQLTDSFHCSPQKITNKVLTKFHIEVSKGESRDVVEAQYNDIQTFGAASIVEVNTDNLSSVSRIKLLDFLQLVI